jgi:glutathione S-transferase
VSIFLRHEVPRGTAGWVAVEEAIAAVVQQLSRGPYLLGDRLSAADILYGTTFAMFSRSPLMEKSPVIDAYAQRVVDRPAFQRAQARESG